MLLKDILQENDYKWVIESASNLGNNPSRATIEALITGAGYDLPTTDMSFFLFDSNGHNMLCNYLLEKDTYFYTSMSQA